MNMIRKSASAALAVAFLSAATLGASTVSSQAGYTYGGYGYGHHYVKKCHWVKKKVWGEYGWTWVRVWVC
jgi:hypothetical protein